MDIFEILGNIYDRSLAIVFKTVVSGNVFLVLFGDCGNLLFDETFFKVLY